MDHVLEGIVRPGALDRRAVTVGKQVAAAS
jgi:hypothetical protein